MTNPQDHLNSTIPSNNNQLLKNVGKVIGINLLIFLAYMGLSLAVDFREGYFFTVIISLVHGFIAIILCIVFFVKKWTAPALGMLIAIFMIPLLGFSSCLFGFIGLYPG